MREEVGELRAEVDTLLRNAVLVEEELGDLLFAMTNLARHLGVDAEQALKKANGKFRRRFAGMEARAGGTEALRSLTTAEMEELWSAVKISEIHIS